MKINDILKTSTRKIISGVKTDLSKLFISTTDNVKAAIMDSQPVQQLKQEETKKTLIQYAPWLGLAVVVIFVIGYIFKEQA